MAALNSLLESKLNDNERNVLIEVKRIFSTLIKPNMSPYEKEKAIHDYLIKTSMYDENGLKSNNISDESHTPYGLLYNHKGVCDAYAETFQIFMYLCGIESYIVIGDTIFNDNKEYKHAWNIVKMGKYYYHVDVTFDNPGPMRFGQVVYKYFNKSDVEMEKTHTWEVMKYPFCLDY
ncbi:MAG TPA: transglutaminase domain-containing protein [Sedimentibacter sp.]|nr:transglutaminase domain-containing protein [Sedimentibacter sp.]